jgi:hypothetical protein
MTRPGKREREAGDVALRAALEAERAARVQAERLAAEAQQQAQRMEALARRAVDALRLRERG